MKHINRIFFLIGFFLIYIVASHASDKTNDATSVTKKINNEILNSLPFRNRQDFEDAKRGLIAELPGGLIQTEGRKRPNWDLNQYAFLDADSSATVNPSLWRQAQLNMANGLFRVTDHIYQVRGLDLATITLSKEKQAGL